MNVQHSERIVVVGAGYGGVGTALRLGRLVGARTSIHLVDGRAEHQLITRLHEVAAGRLAPAAAAVPLRMLLAGTSVQLHRAWVEGIDVQRGRVMTSDGLLEYDRLVLAPGSQTDYRGVPGASELTLPLRTLEDALRVREKLATLLRARTGPVHPGRSGSELTVLVVGGGYTGVELAAELADLRGRSARTLRVGLLEAGSRLLPQSAAWLGKQAAASLERMGVQVFLDAPCLAVDCGGLQVAAGHIRADLVVWAAGIRAPGLLADAGLQVNGAGRALVDGMLTAVGQPEVVVLGDAAAATDSHGTELPPSAQIAVQQAARVADNLTAALRGREAQAFEPRLEGEALSLGAHGGLARVGPLAVEDAPAVLVKKLAAARYLGQLGGPALGALQCARQRLWDWRPQPIAQLPERATERAA
jgi:NADH:quinone reductase (non-electrogenic)